MYVDGPPHDYPERQQRDADQTECLEDYGWEVIRFHHEDDWQAIKPELLELAEKSASVLADGRVKLHPETVQALRDGNDGRTSLILIWIALAMLTAVVLLG